MADHEIKFNTGLDPTGLKEGLDNAISHAESEILRSAAKQTAAVQEAADKQIEIHRKAAKEEIAERKKSIKEQIAAIKARPDLTQEAKQLEIDTVKETEQAKIDAVKASLQTQVSAVQSAADEKISAIRDGTRAQIRELQTGNRTNLRNIEDFATGATQATSGFMKTMTKALKSPVALGAAVVLAGRQIKQFLNSTAEAWRVEEQAQIALAAAARNNPYLNERGVHQLQQFASEMQRLTGTDNVQVMQAQTRLASLGRSQQEIEQIVRTAADIAATGLMSYDQAIDELSNSFGGFTRRLERMFPELKSLSEEALAAGDAVALIAANVSGSAEQAMQSGTGSVTAYRNAIESLRRSIGQDWENATRGWRVAMTSWINRVTEAREETRAFQAALNALAEDPTNVDAALRASEISLNRLREEREALERNLSLRRTMRDMLIEQGNHEASTFDADIDRMERRLPDLNQEIALLETRTGIYSDQVDLITMMERAVNAASRAGTEAAMEAMEIARQRYSEARRQWEGLGDKSRAVWVAYVEEQAKIAEAEVRRIELEEKHARIRAENLEKLNEEIRQIKLRAQIEGRSFDSAEVQQQILNARISSYQALVKEIGGTAEHERQTMRELQAAFLQQQIAAGNRLLDENMRHLETRRREIVAIAELEGRSVYNTQTQSELIDAQVNAYQNQLRILRDLIDGTREEETARRAALEAQWLQYAQRKVSAQAERENLKEAIRLQNELMARAERMYQSASGAIDEHEFRTEIGRLEAMRLDAARRGTEQERAIIREMYDFKVARGKAAITEELEFLREQLETAQGDDADRIQGMIAALEMAHVIEGIQKADSLFTQMLQNVEGPGAERRIIEIQALRLELLDEEIERRREAGEDAARLAEEQARREVEIRQEAADRIREINRRMLDDINRDFNKLLDSIQNIAGNITAIWTNNIDRQTQDKLRANDAMEQSDEERAANERKIMKKAALERYKAELFAWSANVTFATAQAGMAALTAFAEALRGTGPAGPAIAAINAALVTAASMTKVAKVISARPSPPRFHQGGIVQGRIGQEVPAILQAGEPVFTQTQFRNMQEAFANLAHMAYRPSKPEYNVKITNNAAADTRVSAGVDAEGIIVQVEKIVGQSIAKGRQDTALAQREVRKQGREVSTF